jgi:hypothetical protein
VAALEDRVYQRDSKLDLHAAAHLAQIYVDF